MLKGLIHQLNLCNYESFLVKLADRNLNIHANKLWLICRSMKLRKNGQENKVSNISNGI